MARHLKTVRIIDTAHEILSSYNPMTVRQVYYQLVSRQVIKNSRSEYMAVSNALVAARREELIPWSWIEDRLRRPRGWSTFDDLTDFLFSVKYSYSRNFWQDQPGHLEVWLEKDALSGIFADVLSDYQVIFNVGRGYDGWSSIYNAAERFKDKGKTVTILYFGDFDPSGEDMVRSLRERLAALGSYPDIKKIALRAEDVETYNLPPDFTKTSDTRSPAHIAKYGDVSVELDALPAPVLRDRLKAEVEGHMDLEALARSRAQEQIDQKRIYKIIDEIDTGGSGDPLLS